MKDIYALLEELGIDCIQYDHPPVFTCEEAERLLPDDLRGVHTKNLLVRDKKAAHHFLVCVGYEKQVDLKALGEVLGVNKLSFASPERLMKYLGVEPGSVTLLGAMNDTENVVEVVLDQEIFDADHVLCHPLTNTATLSISHDDIIKFLEETEHSPRVINVPARI